MQNQLITQLDLIKGENLNLSKHSAGLTRVAFAMTWKTTRLADGKAADPDLSAFLLGSTGKLLDIPHTGTEAAPINPIIYYKNLEALGVRHTGDDTGETQQGANEADRETIILDFNSVDPRVEAVLFISTMYDDDAATGKIPWDKSTINFGQVDGLSIRAYDADTGDALLKFDLKEDASKYNALILGKLYRHKGEWKFSAMEMPHHGNLNTLRAQYLS